ncbi:MAG: DNA polymerase III subunit gamma/tau [Longimonas sp.]|uniref:DNA polymerase III subunit gamma/tau n=1 Tax=Longimonas sp. TaxID=2039626 RepID=UPI00335595B6
MADRYLVTARKYRPAVFSDLVAQDHVADTLKNAIRLDRLAHAYLFSGPRGVGKTTAARILAKAINCETPLEERPDSAEPCRTCDSCKSFEEGRSLNIFEIDAASNNKVDDIRELRESVRIPPQGSQKKVYIIDEVHMLSNAAFNALLKTLEEPPPHVLFIFATTEPHKVLPTILSRCQRFDFRRIPVPRIVTRLQHICENEGITADEESLMLIARKGDGALRDALSAFDQAVSLCGDTLTYSELAQALGVVDRDLFFQLVDHVANSDSGGVLQLVQRVMSTGYDLQEFLAGLTEHLRHLLVAHTLGPDALSDIAASSRPRYVESSNRFSEADLLRLLMIVGEAETDVKQSSQPRLKLELALLNMAHLSRAGDLQEALNQLSTLQAHAENGTLPTVSADAAAPQQSSQGESQKGAPKRAQGDAHAVPPSSSDASPASSSDSDAPASQAKENASTPSSTGPRASDTPSSAPPADADSSDSSGAPGAAGTAGAPAAESLTARAADAPAEPDLSSASEPPAPPAALNADADDDSSDTDGDTDSDAGDEPGSTAAPEDAPEEDAPEYASEDASEDAPDDTPPSSGSAGAADEAGDDTGYHDLFNPPALSDDDSSAPASGDGSPGNGSPRNADPASSSSHFSGGAPTGVATEPRAQTAQLAELSRTWEDYVERVKQARRSVGSLLGEATPAALNDGTMRLHVPKRLHRDSLMDHQRTLLSHLPNALQDEIDRIEIDVRRPDPETAAQPDPETMNPREQMKALRAKYDGLDDLFKMFGAEPVW